MDIEIIKLLFQGVLLLYVLAAVISLILMKSNKLCNIVSNILCIIAAIIGCISSIGQIISGYKPLNILTLKTNIPFVSINIKLDNLSAYFMFTLSALVLCVSLYSIGYMAHYYKKKNIGLFSFLYATFILSMILVITSSNAVFFFISWEVMSLVSYFLVIFESEKKETSRAGMVYVIMTHIGTAFLVIAFMIMFCYTKSFDIFKSSTEIPHFFKDLMFLLFVVGFGTKAGIIPLHIWLPKAHPAAPSNISALMSGIMLKTAIYGILRFVLFYLHIQTAWWGIILLIIGITSAVLGVAYALMEQNIKRLLAYSSIENIGIILIGLGISFIGFANNNEFLGSLALIASLFHVFNHTMFKGGLFLCAGAIQYSTDTKDIEKLGGLIKKMPYTAVFTLCFSLAISAIVPFNGFVSEWLTYQAIFLNIGAEKIVINLTSIIAIAALGLSGALAAACFVKLFGISFLGKARSPHAENAKEVPVPMLTGMGLLTLACVFTGIMPMFFIKFVEKVAKSLGGSLVTSKLKGEFMAIYYPLSINRNVISPLEALMAIIMFIVIVMVVIRIIAGKYVERKYGTWDCGFNTLNSRMQYSATGFSKPIRIVMKILYRPKHKTEFIEGSYKYHPDKIEYKVSTESIFEKLFYNPVIKVTKVFSRRIKFSIQAGSIHIYLIYIFIAILSAMLYNRIF